ncbi:MAG TPA: cation:proton antiporter [Anaerolineales bacterium]|nr:cation:proton antiporter [Anaerolineales bacterium]
MSRNLIFYVLLIAIFGSLLWFVFNQGAELEVLQSPQTSVGEMSVENPEFGATADVSAFFVFFRNLSQNLRHPLSLLLLQIVIIVLASKLLGSLVSKFGQPLVIGEMIAGILLGSSVLGHFWPKVSNFIFRADSLQNLNFLSQLGLILFMFIIGLELDIHLLKHKAQTAIVVSHASIIIPFAMGVSLAYFLYATFAPPHISFLAFGLFMGIAMSITAFPVLARILQERGLTKTPLGSLAITCAATDDVTAWCILAAVIAIVQAGTVSSAVFTVLLSMVYVIAMLTLVRPWLGRLGAKYASAESLNKSFVVLSFVVLFLSALTTEVIGIHALFGAFLAGVSMPAQVSFRKLLASRIEDVALVILLPLFFAFTGLKTQVGLLNDGATWLVCGLIILVAVAGKFGGSLFAARFTGQSWSDSFAIGALMNTRGLMELIVLNIGYDLGILSPTVFTMMVLMALVTTLMTCPTLSWIERILWKRESMSVKPLPERL